MTIKDVNKPEDIAVDLDRIMKSWKKPLGYAMARVLEDPVMRESRMECPVDIGHLVGTGSVDRPIYTDIGIEVRFGYGAHYAVAQHERAYYRHKAGQKYKFLDDPLNRNLNTIGDQVMDEFDKVCKGDIVFTLEKAGDVTKGGEPQAWNVLRFMDVGGRL